MRIDLILESSESPERIAELSKLAEDNGLGGVWVSNTLSGRDPFLGFLAAAQATDRIHMGPIAVSPYELHPLKMATSLLSMITPVPENAQSCIVTWTDLRTSTAGFRIRSNRVLEERQPVRAI